MTDEPVRIEFSTNAQEAASAIESINAALMKIPEAASGAGGGIDSFVSRSTSALGRLSAEINRVSGELRSLGSATPGMTPTAPTTPVAPVAAAVPPVQQQQQEQVAQQASQYAVREYSYQLDPNRNYMRPVYKPDVTTSSLEEAQQLQQKIKQQPGSYAQIYEQPTQQIQNTNAALKELSDTQQKVAQTPITTPQNVATLQAETQGIQTKNTALNESLTTQRQVTQAAQQRPVTPPPPLAQEVKPAEVAPVAPPVANVAPTEAETAALQAKDAVLKETIVDQQRLATTATKAPEPIAPVATPQTQQASASLQQESAAAQQTTEAMTALNAAKVALAQAEQSLAAATGQATTALQSELAVLQQLAASYRDTATAAGQLAQAQAKVGTITPTAPQPVTPVAPQPQVVPQQTPPPIPPVQPQQEMTVDELRELYGGALPTRGVGAGLGRLDLPEPIQQATTATERLANAEHRAADAGRQQVMTAQELARLQEEAAAAASLKVTRTTTQNASGDVRQSVRASYVDEQGVKNTVGGTTYDEGFFRRQTYKVEDQNIRLLQEQARATKDYEPALVLLF